MKRHPEGAGCDDDPRRRLRIAAGGRRWEALSSYLTRSAVRKVFSTDARRPENASDAPKRRLRRSAGLTSKAAETLRSASGGVPVASGEAAVTRDRRDRERHAVRSRGGRGRGAESAGWREVAEWCRATEGSGHE